MYRLAFREILIQVTPNIWYNGIWLEILCEGKVWWTKLIQFPNAQTLYFETEREFLTCFVLCIITNYFEISKIVCASYMF